MSDSISEKKTIQWRTVTALGAATWLVSTQLSGCSAVGGSGEGEGEGEGEREGRAVQAASLAGGEAGEGGEGEGGEGEGGTDAQASLYAEDDVAYLTQLGLIRGHLAVGYALYSNGLPDLAQTHMKHPRAEIYASVAPAFAVRGCPGFADSLAALTHAVTERAEQAQVDTVYRELTAAIAACEAGAQVGAASTQVQVIENLLRTAAMEYAIGIVDESVNNLHEYQDAWGFTQVAASIARSSAFASDERGVAVAARIQDIIADVSQMWPSLNPDGSVPHHASRLYGAAGQVQVAAFELTR